MRILVTGASGFVGSHAVQVFSAAGHEVWGMTSKPREPEVGLQWVVADIADRAALSVAFDAASPDAVLHLAAQASVPNSWSDPETTYATNVIGPSNLLYLLRDNPGVKTLLVGSAQQYRSAPTAEPLTEDAPMEPSSPYAVSKLAQEAMGLMHHREMGLPVLAARPFNHIGPGQSGHYVIGAFMGQIVEMERGRAKTMTVGNLESRRDFIDVRDVAEAYRVLLERGKPGQVYNVSCGKAHRIGDLLDTLLDTAGLRGEVEVVEKGSPRPGDPPILAGDNSKLAALGWSPDISLEKSLVDTLEWARAHS